MPGKGRQFEPGVLQPSRANTAGVPKTEEWKAAAHAARAGKPRSEAWKAAISLSTTRAHEQGLIGRPAWRNTALEARLWRFLVEAGYTIEIEKSFGRYRVDVYLPDYHVAFEADGWHHAQYQVEHDLRRDAWLWENCQLPVVRLDYREIEGWEFSDEKVARERKEEIHRWVEEACG